MGGSTIIGNNVQSHADETCKFASNTEYLFRSLTIKVPSVTFEDGTLVQTRETFNITSSATRAYINGRVHLTSNGSMEIQGILDGNGRGYPSHTSPPDLDFERPKSSGGGHGGSHGGVGDGLGDRNDYKSTYGSIRYPTTMGSGGGKGYFSRGGGSGGAAIRLTVAGKLTVGRRWETTDKSKIFITMNGNDSNAGYERRYNHGHYHFTHYHYHWEPGGGGAQEALC